MRDLTGLSRTTLWRLERAGWFPKHVTMSVHAVGWIEAEVIAWIESKAKTSRTSVARDHAMPDMEECHEGKL